MSASASNSENTVKKIYQTVIDEVLENIREAFLDEGYDESVLQDLKQMWEQKLNASRAVQSLDEAASSSESRLANNQQSSKETVHHSHHLSHSHQTKSSNPVGLMHQTDIKPNIQIIDPATRAALQALPQSIYQQQQQQQQAAAINSQELNQKLKKHITQVDGGVDGSSSDEDEDDNDIVGSIHGDEDEEDDKTNNDDGDDYEGKEDSDPLNSEDDLTEPGSPNSNSDLFDTEHVIVCQYDKITRIKNKWKFHLKDGIMNINGRDYLFSKANGDAEW